LRADVSQTNIDRMDELLKWLDGERGRVMTLAKECERTHGAISQWTRVPSDLVLIVERVTNIRREVLRPDLYGELEAQR
jgi:hypothetical protein